ncbi:MAG: hypothetical protein R3F43_30210 [bacterium]
MAITLSLNASPRCPSMVASLVSRPCRALAWLIYPSLARLDAGSAHALGEGAG